MLLEELIKRERKEAREEGKLRAMSKIVIGFLQKLGTIPAELQTKILTEANVKVLESWVTLAAKATSIEQFMQEME